MDNTEYKPRPPVIIRALVTIHDIRPDAPDGDRTHTLATIERATTFTLATTVKRVDVYLNPRGVYTSAPEWLEHVIVVHYITETRAPLTIGCIQRAPGNPSEFCS